jgi:TatD DNase family protein
VSDIAVNLTDPMFRGVYRGKQAHQGLRCQNFFSMFVSNSVQDDFKQVLERAYATGVDKILITGTSLSESRQALELAQTDGSFLLILLNIVC